MAGSPICPSKRIAVEVSRIPRSVSFRHPDPSILETISGAKLLAQDDFPKSKEVLNLGQYNLLPLMSNLPTDQRLILTLTLQETDLKLTIPSAVMVEWRSVIEEQEKM